MRMIFAIAAILLAVNANATAAEYVIDPVHTRVLVFVEHAGFSHSIGTFSGASGSLTFDPDHPQAARVAVVLPLQRMDFGDADWNKKLAGALFFSSKRYPQIRFVSSAVEVLDAQHFRVHGTLELKGEAHEVVLEATLNSLRRHPMTLRQTIGFSATTSLDRRKFALGAYPKVIGNSVPVRIELEATRTAHNAAPSKGPATP